MRIHQADLQKLMACPVCKRPLHASGSAICCVTATCTRNNVPVPSVRGVDVLIDFKSSILKEEDLLGTIAASPIDRPDAGGARSFVRDLIFGVNTVAAANEQILVDKLVTTSNAPTCLVVGGGTSGSGMSKLYTHNKIAVIAFDVYNSPAIDFIADAHSIPLRAESVDAVWIQAVLEHVLNPWEVVAEIYRVLKPGGFVYAETPFLQQVHEKAYDFTRFTHSGHRWLFREFEEVGAGSVGGGGTQMLWSVEHFTRGLLRSVICGKFAKLVFFWLRFCDPLFSTNASLDTASGFYFFGKKSDRVLRPHEMVEYYSLKRR